jgi:hypothetical protein
MKILGSLSVCKGGKIFFSISFFGIPMNPSSQKANYLVELFISYFLEA